MATKSYFKTGSVVEIFEILRCAQYNKPALLLSFAQLRMTRKILNAAKYCHPERSEGIVLTVAKSCHPERSEGVILSATKNRF